jgi:hypothetical protein
VRSGAVAPASTDAPGTWRRREAAEILAAELRADGQHAGIGIVAHRRRSGEHVAVIDLDAAINPASGTLKGWAEAILLYLPTFAEISPSGGGVHIVLRIAAVEVPAVEALLQQGRKIRAGRKWFREAPPGQKAEGIEFIWRGYATFTGARLLDQPRDVRVIAAEALRWLCDFAELFKDADRDVPPESIGHVARDRVGASAHPTSTAAPPATTDLARLQSSQLVGVLEAETHESALAAKQQRSRRMEWDAVYVSGLAARLDDVEFSVAAAYATVGRPTRDGRAEAGVSVARLLELTGRQHGSRSSSQVISGAKARLVGEQALFTQIEPAVPPAFGRAGCAARFDFKGWWSPGKNKLNVHRVVLEFAFWEGLLRGGGVRRRSLRIIVRILSDLAIMGDHPSEAFRPKPYVLARALHVKPGDVNEALDDAERVGLFHSVEARRDGIAALYTLSLRGAARWPTRRFPAI